MHTKDPFKYIDKHTQSIKQSEYEKALGLQVIWNFVEKYLMNKTLQETVTTPRLRGKFGRFQQPNSRLKPTERV